MLSVESVVITMRSLTAGVPVEVCVPEAELIPPDSNVTAAILFSFLYSTQSDH